MDYQHICSRTIEVIKKTGQYISGQAESFSSDLVETKGLHNFVSFVDKNAEKQLIEGLEPLIPGAGFIAEEETVKTNNSHYKWIIDPLDGTTNFIHSLAPYAISVALMEGDELVIGIVYEITRNETFYSWKGAKAFLDGREIRVSKAGKVKDSLIATGFPYYDYECMSQFLNSLDYFMRNSHGLRRLGSAATDLAYVACGRFEAFYEYSLSPWDVAAGAFIVMQAGGKVCDFKGGDNYIFGREIIASNSLMHDEFLQAVKSVMNRN